MKMLDEDLVSIVNSEFETAMGADGGEISTERARAWDYYLSKKFGDEVDGSSQVVTSDVSDVVDGIMPSLLRIFTTAENLVNFDAVGVEDEEKAAQESDYVNYVFFKQNKSFEILYSWFFDALVQKNGIVKAWWDESEEISVEPYEGLNDLELVELLNDDELEPVERSERMAETVDANGQIVEEIVHDIIFRRVCKKNKVSVANVPPEEYRISSDACDLDPSKARMVGHEREVTRSELLDMGFDEDIVEDLPAYRENALNSSEKISRKDKTDEYDNGYLRDSSQDIILLREAYIKIDFDDDGRSELRQVFTAGNKLLSNESVDRQPFHVITPQPLPHKHFGRATAEKVMDIQEVNSTLLRQTLNNLYHTNNPGHAVWEQAMGESTLEDLLTTQVGRVARFNRPVGEAYAPMTTPFTAAASFPMLEYFDKLKRDRTGISSDAEGLSPESMKNIQTSVLAQAVDISKMKVEAIARIFAETGIKSLMLHIHELLLKHQQKAQIVKLRNTWVEVDPRSWRTRFDMTVNIGLGIGTREQNLLHLNAIWEKQRDIVSAGGLGSLVTPMNIYNTTAEIVKNANLKSPEMFFTPTNEIPQQQDPMAQQQIALAQRQQDLDAQDQQLKAQKQDQDYTTKQQELMLKQEQMMNDLLVNMEKMQNQLTDMELKYGQNVPGAKV